ncbi:MAG: hypothetical protein CXT70_05040 [Methanobacteriota archaeon]|nr:MAG: hypothetical protein CXT70_05040 [Euryarchaeota archaeon]
MQERSGFKIVLAILLAILVGSGSYVIEKPIECADQQILTPDGCVDPGPEPPKPQDCTLSQVWRDGNCHDLIPPNNLTYGAEVVQWAIGEIHILTPSFSGDGPDSWAVNPAFPAFITIDENSGEILAAPQSEHSTTTHVIIASNNGGVVTTNLTISVINIVPMFSYPSPQWTFVLGSYDELPLPIVGDMSIDNWQVTPQLPEGLILDSNGRIGGTAVLLGTTNHSVIATNSGGSASAEIQITVVDEAPSLWYPALGNAALTLSKGIVMQTLVATSSQGPIIACDSQPQLPSGLVLASNCNIEGTPTVLLEQSNFLITGSNSGGITQHNLSLTIIDQPLSNILYGSGTYTFAKQVDSLWSIHPQLPTGISFNNSSGAITGIAQDVNPTTTYTIQANNTGGTGTSSITLTFIDITPRDISYLSTEVIVESNQSNTQINISNLGDTVDTWQRWNNFRYSKYPCTAHYLHYLCQ